MEILYENIVPVYFPGQIVCDSEIRRAVGDVFGWVEISVASWISAGCLLPGSERRDILVGKHSGAAKITRQLQMGVIIHPPKFYRPHSLANISCRWRQRRFESFHCNASLENSQEYVEGNVASLGEDGNICMRRKRKWSITLINLKLDVLDHVRRRTS